MVRSPLLRLSAVRFAQGECSLVVGLLSCAAVRLGSFPTLVIVSLITVLFAGRLPTLFATGLGLVAWAMFTGFVVNRYGVLTFSTGDLIRMGLLLGLGTLATPRAAPSAGPVAAHWTR